MTKVKKAVIPAAGLGTRVLPASKAMPKEMLTIVDKPAIQYIVEEAVESGIEDILIITNRGKTVIEDHFDRSFELESKLLSSKKEKAYEEIKKISQMANIYYIRQKETKGLGHAVYCAKSFVGDDPFAVLYGDDIIINKNNKPACLQLCEAYDKYNLGVVGIKEVSDEQILSYSSLKVSKIEDKIYKVLDMIEKPTPDKVLSNFSILGRCVLDKNIFDLLENLPAGKNGEIQLTDAMAAITKTTGMIGVNYDGIRYDIGNKLEILKAIVEIGLDHVEIGKEFNNYLKNKFL
ncbi:MAG: UTP--glucose-1-phosphate uridylyltransferase GalU [Oscillospiraceae bacterium]|nr:UTP--glucose-1-phosphate uridylyltransferase GalU [Oscillospiraceae bacterium]